MPEIDVAELVVSVESNTDALTALAIHAMLESLVERIITQGEDMLRANVILTTAHEYPPRSDDLAAHVAHHPVVFADDVIQGSVGIPAIEEARARELTTGDSDPADYPVFRDRGTGIFGDEPHQITPVTRKRMKFEGKDGEDVFRHSVAGQEGAHFTRITYDEMFSALPGNVEIFEQEVKALAL